MSRSPRLIEVVLMQLGVRYCPSCGSIAHAREETRGSGLLEMVLWLFCGVGLLYSLWRHTTKREVCSVCGNSGMVPITSPRAMQDPACVRFVEELRDLAARKPKQNDSGDRLIGAIAAFVILAALSWLVVVGAREWRRIDRRAAACASADSVVACWKSCGAVSGWSRAESEDGTAARLIVLGGFDRLTTAERSGIASATATLADSGESKAVVIIERAGSGKIVGTWTPQKGYTEIRR